MKKRGLASPIKKESSADLLSVMGFPKGLISALPTIMKPPPQVSKNEMMAQDVKKLDEQDTTNLMHDLREAAKKHKEMLMCFPCFGKACVKRMAKPSKYIGIVKFVWCPISE